MAMSDDIDDTWISVPRSKKSRPQQPTINGHNPPSRTLSLEALVTDYNSKARVWQKSNCRQTLFRLLNRLRPDDGWNLKRTVCLGSGSLSRENIECKRRSFWQVVVFLDIVKQLGMTEEVYVQDPTYTGLDGEFFDSLGVKMLRMEDDAEKQMSGMGPSGEVLGPDTLLYEPFVDMNADMVHEMLKRDVGLYIGSSIGGLIAKGHAAEAVKVPNEQVRKNADLGNLAKRFSVGRGMYKFPTFEVDPNIFEGVQIRYKEEKDDD